MAELAQTLTYLRAAYPRAQFPPETVTVYAHELGDLPDAEVAEACRRIARRSMYLPTIAEIRREVIEGRHAWPSAGVAWGIVLSGDVKAWAERCPPLIETYKALGGRWEVMNSRNIGALRHSFERDYDQRVEQEILAEMGAKVHELPPAGSRLSIEQGGPRESQKRMAIRILQHGPATEEPIDDPLYCEAERIFAEGAS